jgi:hypothetical protein
MKYAKRPLLFDESDPSALKLWISGSSLGALKTEIRALNEGRSARDHGYLPLGGKIDQLRERLRLHFALDSLDILAGPGQFDDVKPGSGRASDLHEAQLERLSNIGKSMMKFGREATFRYDPALKRILSSSRSEIMFRVVIY